MNVRGLVEAVRKNAPTWLKANIRIPKWYGVAFVILFLSFMFNIFGTGSQPNWFDTFEKNSEQIVIKTAQCRSEGVSPGYSGPLVAKDGPAGASFFWHTCDLSGVQVYGSQFGLQARVIAYFAPNNPDLLQLYFNLTSAMLAALLVLVLLVFVRFVQKEFGKIPAATLLGFMAISDWIIGYSRNLYWASFLMFLPMVFSFVSYRWFKNRAKLPWFYALLAIFMWLKMLDGYEHVTTVGISALLPVLYFELKNKVGLLKLWRQAVIVGLCTIIAFVAAYSIHLYSLERYYHSWAKAKHAISQRAEARADFKMMQSNVIERFEVTQPVLFYGIDPYYDLDALKKGDKNPINYAVLSLVDYLMLPAYSLPVGLRPAIGVAFQSILFVAVTAYFLLRYVLRGRDSGETKAMWLLYWGGLIAAFSWLMAMPGHAYAHPHINGIVFYMPFILICYVIFGLAFAKRFPRFHPGSVATVPTRRKTK